jgi:uncharacterized membrane protein
MKRFRDFVVHALVGGFLLAVPVYLTVLLLLKAMKSVAALVRPFAALHPQGMSSAIAEQVLAFFILMFGCFVLGAAALTKPGRIVEQWFEQSVFERIPGYSVVRGLMRQLTGQAHEHEWQPALAEMDDGVAIVFIIEETGDGRYTVFVPGSPSPVSGSVYIIERERVHPVNVPFTRAFTALSKWGSGTRDLVAALEEEQRRAERRPKAS